VISINGDRWRGGGNIGIGFASPSISGDVAT
jgi:hypothetical protein